MTVYIDIIFLENLFMNYIILFATAIIVKTPIKLLKTFLASTLGSVYAIITYITQMEIFTNIFLKVILSITITYIAFTPKSLKLLLKQLLIFYLTSFTFGGVAFALLYFINPEKIYYEGGRLIGTYPIKVVLVGGILGFIITIIAFKNVKGRITKRDMHCNLKIELNDKEEFIKAIIDTGNFLKEPITKTPVIIVEKESLQGLISENILNSLDKIIKGEDNEIEDYASKIRIIPFSSLGKQNGILLGIKGDSLIVNLEEKNIYIKDFIIGIYDGILSKNGKYQALIGLDILDQTGGEIDEYSRFIKV